ncbi:MAG: hypothetical protein AAF449_04525, partial [Myxococcota bacterium]
FGRAVQVGFQVLNRGQAAGTVTATPPPNAQNCSVDCSDRYLASTGTVELTAAAPVGTRFEGWVRVGGGPACAGDDSALRCEVDVSDGVDRVLQARFVSEQRITVNLAGEGEGRIDLQDMSASANWTCGPTQCVGDFVFGQSVTLLPVVTPPNYFEGFRSSVGTCSGDECTVVVDTVDLTIDAEIEVARLLELTVSGNTGGSVTLPPSFDEPAPLTCTDDCSRSYLSGRTFTLVAERPVNVAFNGWQGCNADVGTSCEVVMDADPKRLTAPFSPARVLDLELLGTGDARVDIAGTGNPSVCSGAAPLTCPTLTYPSGSTITLTVPSLMGTNFEGWGGDCAGTVGTVCTLLMDQNRMATATFARRTHDVTINFAGAAAASGVVAWINPPRPDGGGPDACTETVDEGTNVGLRAIEGVGYDFVGWSGCDRVLGGDECRLDNVSAATAVTATFAPLDDVRILLTGSGTGRIVWNDPVRPTCERSVPALCPVEQVVSGQTVTLTAEPANLDTEFVAWTGCGGSGATCVLSSVSGPTTATAEFVALHDVTIGLAGDGNGRVIWTSPVFPDCVVGTCPPRKVREGSTVTLTAQNVAGSTFTGWSGCDAVGGPDDTVCTLNTVTQDRNPSAAYFDDRTITVRMRGTGSAGLEFSVGGQVVASCADSPLPYDCTETFAYTAGVVSLSTVTSSATTFTGWDLGCTGTGLCLVDIQQSTDTQTRQANFN